MPYNFGIGKTVTRDISEGKYGFGVVPKDEIDQIIVEKQAKPKPLAKFTLPKIGTEGITPSKIEMPKRGWYDWFSPVVEKAYNIPAAAAAEMINSISDLTSVSKSAPLSRKVGKSLGAVVSAVEFPISFISAPFAMAEDIPILKYPAKAVSKVFEVVGEAGATVFGGAVEYNPLLSEEAKQELNEPFRRLGALVAQIAVAHRTAKVAPKSIKTLETIGRDIKNDINVKVKKVQDGGVIVTPEIAKRIADSAIRDIEKIAPKRVPFRVEPEMVPKKPPSKFVKEVTEGILADMNRSAAKKVSRPFIEERLVDLPKRIKRTFERVLDEVGDRAEKAVFEARIREELLPEPPKPIARPVEPIKVEKPPKIEAVEAPERIPRVVEPVEKPPKPPKISEKLIEKAVEEGILKEKIELPKVERMEMAEQAKLGKEFRMKDEAEFVDVAMGTRPPPGKLTAETVWKVAEAEARAKGDARMVDRLLHESTLPAETVRLGQRIKSLDYGDMMTSPASLLSKVKGKRGKAAEKRLGKGAEKKIRESEKKSLDKEIKKEVTKKKPWDDFLDSIEC